jgi:hypothetical protein
MNGMKSQSKTIATIAIAAILLAGAGTASALSLSPVSQTNISNNFNPQFYEASGLGLAKNQTKLWSVSDGNFVMYKMELNGAKAEDFTPTPASSSVPTITNTDFEGVTFGPPPPNVTDDHFIYLANERVNGIVPVNYETRKYNAQVTLSSMTGYATVNCQGGTRTVKGEFDASDSNSGLEGITWDSDAGYFYVIKEKNPGLMIQISEDLGSITACKRLTFSVKNGVSGDYSDISYDPTRQQFWILSDESEAVYLYNWNTGASQRHPLTYAHGEGVSFNPDTSRLYIVTDNGSNTTSYLYTYNVQ